VLLLERNNIFALAGFTVISSRAPEQGPMLAAQQDVDAVIIGHSVRPHTRKTLIMDLRRVCPDCLICFVYAAPETKGEPLADVSLNVSSGPESLVRYLQDRLPREKVSWNPLQGSCAQCKRHVAAQAVWFTALGRTKRTGANDCTDIGTLG